MNTMETKFYQFNKKKTATQSGKVIIWYLYYLKKYSQLEGETILQSKL